MPRSHLLAVVATLGVVTNFNAWAAESLPVESHKVLTAALAVEAAQAAIAACKAQGYNVTVTVADRIGTPKVVIVRAPSIPACSIASSPQGRAAYPSRWAKTRSVESRSAARLAATRTRRAQSPASTRSRTG
jgi:uncharacterized protein GlcG (DUF336 family)